MGLLEYSMSTNEADAIGVRAGKSVGAAPAAGQSVNKRLQSELMSLMMSKDAGISASAKLMVMQTEVTDCLVEAWLLHTHSEFACVPFA